MTRSLSSGTPGPSEDSHGRGRFGHPDSDFQSGRAELAWAVADRNQGSKRGGFTAAMRRQAELRTDGTRSDEIIEDMLYVKGNPDAYGPDQPIVQEPRRVAPAVFKQPVIRTGVDRQD